MMLGFQHIIVVLLVAASVATDLNDKSRLRTKNDGAINSGAGSGRKIVQQAQMDQDLVICNAYASPASLDIYHVQTLERVTGKKPLKYKECREFSMPLAEGDQLDFKAESTDVGTFYATGLPKASASLLLIPHRRDSHSVAISFESHAIADLQSPQIAVVDAYKGKGAGAEEEVRITDVLPEGENEEPIEEMLKFSSVVAVNAGSYKVALSATGNSTTKLLAENKAKYVVMRVGIDSTMANGGKPYPQELVVFPRSGSHGLNVALYVLALFGSAFWKLF